MFVHKVSVVISNILHCLALKTMYLVILAPNFTRQFQFMPSGGYKTQITLEKLDKFETFRSYLSTPLLQLLSPEFREVFSLSE